MYPAFRRRLMLLASLSVVGSVPLTGQDVHVADWPAGHARCRPVPLTHVKAKGFLGRRIEANLQSVLKGLESPIPRRFEARVAGREPGPETDRLAADSDLYKWMEGAAYMYALTGDRTLGEELERIAGLVLACQKDDGYINTQVPPNVRFDPKINHDLYSAGHFFEAAVAHYRTSGKTHLLDAAGRWADYLITEYEDGNPYFGTVAEKEHSEYELGLLRLARATRKPRYMDFAATLARMIPAGPSLLTGPYCGRGHAVRVNYLLAGYADLYLETGRAEFLDNLADTWNEIVNTRSFVTGGVSVHERYQQQPYYLPRVTDHPRRDIAETCTSISLAMFGWRLHAIEPDNAYFDQIEKILYNHYLGAVSLDHLSTFYYNSLQMLDVTEGKTDHDGPLTRRTELPEIHSTACCVANEWRFFGALSEYLFSYDEQGLYVNLYTSSEVRHKLPSGVEAALSIETDYPHTGTIKLSVDNPEPARFALRLRVPKWCRSARLVVGEEAPRATAGSGYVVLDRRWEPGTQIRLELDMPVRLLLPDPRDKENAGQGVLTRGPLVYCLEQVDADFPIGQARWALRPDQAAERVRVQWKEDLLGGVNVLTAPGVIAGEKRKDTQLTLVPFYARANRDDDNHWMTYLPLPSP